MQAQTTLATKLRLAARTEAKRQSKTIVVPHIDGANIRIDLMEEELSKRQYGRDIYIRSIAFWKEFFHQKSLETYDTLHVITSSGIIILEANSNTSNSKPRQEPKRLMPIHIRRPVLRKDGRLQGLSFVNKCLSPQFSWLKNMQEMINIKLHEGQNWENLLTAIKSELEPLSLFPIFLERGEKNER